MHFGNPPRVNAWENENVHAKTLQIKKSEIKGNDWKRFFQTEKRMYGNVNR